jgi:hypothetical protein
MIMHNGRNGCRGEMRTLLATESMMASVSLILLLFNHKVVTVFNTGHPVNDYNHPYML